jgi:protein pelota
VVEENQYVKLGAFHTLDLELNRSFDLEKADGWDSVALETLKEAVEQSKKAVLWAVIMQEGLAHICLITDHTTIMRQKVEVQLPKKRAGSTDHDKQLQKFFQLTLDSLLRQIDPADPTPILLASPGFTASSFLTFIKTLAASGAHKTLAHVARNITVAHAASGYLHSLGEVLSSPAVTAQLSDTKFARETQLMDKLTEMLRKDDQRAWYGPRECEQAIERGAVGKGGGVLLISNALFRSQDIQTRKRWVRAVDDVKEQGGEVRVLSSMHESGRRLEGLGGIAAILTFPIEDLDEGLEDVEGGHDLEDLDGDDDDDVMNSNGIEGVEGKNRIDEVWQL